jgi:hypothetical protein
MALDEAIERVLRVYGKEGKHATSPEIVAQHLGYKNATSGAAASAIASLRYYGLIERRPENKVAVSKDIEAYKFAPDEDIKRTLAIKWLKSVTIFGELLSKYSSGLPSDATIRYDLIQRGFMPTAADTCVIIFKRSVDWTAYFSSVGSSGSGERSDTEEENQSRNENQSLDDSQGAENSAAGRNRSSDTSSVATEMDRIPVRLTGGRRAWVEIPSPFFQADKDRLKAQIDLILTDDEGGSS